MKIVQQSKKFLKLRSKIKIQKIDSILQKEYITKYIKEYIMLINLYLKLFIFFVTAWEFEDKCILSWKNSKNYFSFSKHIFTLHNQNALACSSSEKKKSFSADVSWVMLSNSTKVI